MSKLNSIHLLLAASAMTSAVLASGGAARAEASLQRFDIPAEPMAQALRDYSQASGQQILFSESIVGGRRSVEVHGRYSAAQALQILLGGSGLVADLNPAGVMMIRARPAPSASAANDGGEGTAAPANALETVVVTAQKRRESSQDVPITLTAVTAATLEQNRVQNLSDLSRLVPGLLISTFSENSPTIAIRGASNTFEQIGVSKPVAVVVDDVFVSRPSASVFKLFDLDSVDVLEGPQGTLFGRNVTGGAIVIETKKPVFDHLGFAAEATGGNRGDEEFAGLVNAPVGSNAAFNLTADYQKRDGWGEDRLTGEHEDGIDSQNYRGAFRVRLRDDLDVLFSADYSYDKNGGRTLSSTSVGDDGDPRTSELGVHQSFNRALAGSSIKVVWSPPQGEVTSITAYRRDESGEIYSGVGANWAFLPSGSQQSVNSDKDQVGDFTQELRYASPRWSHGDFVTGFYFLYEDGARELGTNGLAGQTGALASSTLANEHVDTTSYAFFVDGTLHIVPTLDLSAGARYTVDDKTANLGYADLLHSANSFNVNGSKASWGQWTPRAVLTWRPMTSALLYLSATRGFTAGGFNTDASSVKAFAQTFQPEVVTNYELGAKTQWLQGRLRLNMSLFDMQYHNKQELVFNSNNGILDIVNAASATSKGFETTAAAKLLSWLDLTVGYSRLVTKYGSFVLGSTNNTGHELSSSPPNKLSVDANFDYPLDGRGFIVGSVNYSWIDDYNTGAAGDPRLEVPSYGLTNLNIGYETPDRRYRISGWVRNLSNTNYVLTNSTQVVTATYLGEPRTFGVTVHVSY